jgi:hypothetical protein
MRFRWGGVSRRGNRCAVFVVQWLETFEIVAPVVRVLRDMGWTAAIVVTPERSAVHATFDGSYDLERLRPMCESLRSMGFAPEPLVPVEAEADRLRELRPAAVFMPTPYDAQRHESLAASRLKLPIHYVNYGLNISPHPDIEFELPFYGKCAAIYSENEYCTEHFARAGVRRARIIPTGSPALDHWDVERSRSDEPTVLWCPHWTTRWHDASAHTIGYSTFLPSYRAVLDEAERRPHMRFIIRPHPYLWEELRSESLWTEDDEHRFHERALELKNVTVEGGVTVTTRYPLYPSHLEQFEQAWAMVTDGISFLAEFGYTGKPILLTEARGNPGWNPVGRAIRNVVQRSDGIQGLASFLDQIERGIDPDAERRREVIRGLFYRPPGGSARAIARHLSGVVG